jgi:serine phosphatase RsbU (regulator of sigma subunit)
VLFTDGITEAARTDDLQFGDKALFDVVRARGAGSAAREIADTILDGSSAFAADGFQDDATVLVASFY